MSHDMFCNSIFIPNHAQQDLQSGLVRPVTRTLTFKTVCSCSRAWTCRTDILEFYPEYFGGAPAVYQHASQLTTINQAHVVSLLHCMGAIMCHSEN